LGLTIGTDVAPAGISGDFVGRVATFIGLTPPSGWLLLNGDTIGNLSSGADHESADFEDLFILFWDSMANAQAPVSTGRGASGSNDWIAGKTLTLPDARGRLVLGSGTGNSLSERVHGSTGGAETHLLTANESGLRAHNHTYQRYLGGHVEGSLNGNPNTWFNVTTVNTSTVPAADASEAHNNMQPYLALNFIVKY
jgi:microcystin-dependent protein